MIRAACTIAVCMTLTACSHQPRSSEPQPIATIVAETQVAQINENVTPAMLVGRWSRGGDCVNAINMSSSGAFQSDTSGAGTWELTGNMLTMTTSTGASQVWVGAIGSDQLVFAQADRSANVWLRCPQQH